MKRYLKKVLIIIILFAFAFSTINVNAIEFDPIESRKNPFVFGWETEPKSILKMKNINSDSETESRTIDIALADNNYEYKNGYVVTNIVSTITNNTPVFDTNLIRYDKTGNEITKKNLDNEIVQTMKSDDNYLYTISFYTKTENDETEYHYYVKKYDENLNVLKSIDLFEAIAAKSEENSNTAMYITLVSLLPKIIGYDSICIDEEKVILLTGIGEYLIVDKNFKTITFEPTDEETMNTYFPNVMKELKLLEEFFTNEEDSIDASDLYVATDIENEYRISSGITINTESELDLNHGLVIPQEVIDNIEDEITSGDGTNNEGTTEEEIENGSTIESYQEYITYDSKIALYKNEELVWERNNKDYVIMFDTHIIGDYIVTIGANIDVPSSIYDGSGIQEIIDNDLTIDDKRTHEILSELVLEFGFNTDILVYDKKGNLVQTISDDSIYIELFPSKSGFITNNIEGLPKIKGIYKHIVDNYLDEVQEEPGESGESGESGNPSDAGKFASSFKPIQYAVSKIEVSPDIDKYLTELLEEFPIKTSHKVWHVVSNVNVIVDGKGSVDVIDSSTMGEEVTFKVVPKEGYVLSEVKVIDANGNVIIFKDYTFTMPSRDVTIEAVFKKVYNPNTSAFLIGGMILLGGASLIIIKKYKNKLTWLK